MKHCVTTIDLKYHTTKGKAVRIKSVTKIHRKVEFEFMKVIKINNKNL